MKHAPATPESFRKPSPRQERPIGGGQPPALPLGGLPASPCHRAFLASIYRRRAQTRATSAARRSRRPDTASPAGARQGRPGCAECSSQMSGAAGSQRAACRRAACLATRCADGLPRPALAPPGSGIRKPFRKGQEHQGLRGIGGGVPGGEGGIRTHGTDKPYFGFRDRPVRPLRHLSVAADPRRGASGRQDPARLRACRRTDRRSAAARDPLTSRQRPAAPAPPGVAIGLSRRPTRLRSCTCRMRLRPSRHRHGPRGGNGGKGMSARTVPNPPTWQTGQRMRGRQPRRVGPLAGRRASAQSLAPRAGSTAARLRAGGRWPSARLSRAVPAARHGPHRKEEVCPCAAAARANG